MKAVVKLLLKDAAGEIPAGSLVDVEQLETENLYRVTWTPKPVVVIADKCRVRLLVDGQNTSE